MHGARERILLAYTVLYGAIMINYIDFRVQYHLPGYHLWLVSVQLAPFLVLIFVEGRSYIKEILILFLLSSLLNDLLYAPIGYLMGVWKGDLIKWYLWQLGLRGFDPGWNFDLLVTKVKVFSIYMGLSIYARGLLLLVLVRWPMVSTYEKKLYLRVNKKANIDR